MTHNIALHFSFWDRPINNPNKPSARTLTGLAIAACFQSVVAFTFLLSLQATIVAQELPDRPTTEQLLPETTVLFAKVTNFATLFEKLQEGFYGKMLADEQVGPLADQLYEYAQDQYGRVQDEVGMSLDELRSLPTGELSIAIVKPRRKKQEVVVLIELDDENDAVDKAFGRVRELSEIENESSEFEVKLEKTIIDGQTVFFCRHDGVLIVSSSKSIIEEMFVRWSGGEVEKVRSLAQNRRFISINNQCRTSDDLPADMKFYIDPIGIFKASAAGDVGMQVVVAVLPVFGLDGLLAVGGNYYAQTDGYESLVHGHVMLASPREGLFDAIALKPGDYQPEDWVPVNVASYITTSWDIQQMYAGIEEMSNLVSDGSFDLFMEDFKLEAGFDFKESLVDQFTGRISALRPILDGSKLNSVGNIFSVELKDPEYFTQFLEQQMSQEEARKHWSAIEHQGIRYWTLGDIYKRSEESARKWRESRGIPPRERPERDLTRETMRFPHPSCAVVGDHLVFGDSEEFLKAAIDTLNGDQEALIDAAEYQENSESMTRLLKTELPACVMYFDSAREFEVLSRAIDSQSIKKIVAEQAEERPEFFQGLKDALEDNALPDYDVIKKYLPTSGAFITSDDSGYHFLMFQEATTTED